MISSILPPGGLRDLAVLLHARTAGLLRVVDAPVLGPPDTIASGRYSMVIGAAPSIFRAVQPVLEVLGPCTRIGGIGTAQIAKACEQFVLAATTLAAIEATAISLRAGVGVRAVPGWTAVTEEDKWAMQVWSAPFESARSSTASLRAALEVVRSEATRGPDTGYLPSSGHDHLEPGRRYGNLQWSQGERTGAASHTERPGPLVQVSCKITITKMMMTSTPIMVPISPLFMDRPPLWS